MIIGPAGQEAVEPAKVAGRTETAPAVAEHEPAENAAPAASRGTASVVGIRGWATGLSGITRPGSRVAGITEPAEPIAAIAGRMAADVAGAARELLAGLVTRPQGQPSPSVYETGRLVALAPWLPGHRERLVYLMTTRRPDGLWGPHEDYALVPTLSATEALLAELVRCVRGAAGAPDPSRDPRLTWDAVAESAWRGLLGLRALLGPLAGPGDARRRLPDLPAIELIVPALVESANRSLRELAELDEAWPAGAGITDKGGTARAGWAPLPLPAGMDTRRLEAIRSAVRAGAPLPEKLLHALEIAGETAFQASGVRLTPAGSVGASPAATAAWLGELGAVDPGHPAQRYLRAAAEPYGGPVPCAAPIAAFERGWVVSWLLRAGVPVTVPGELTASLRDGLGPIGMPAGPGLPADSDTTSVALYALALLGEPCDPGSLLTYRAGAHFCTWQGEDGASTTVNAHVLDAFGEYVAACPQAAPRYREAMAQVAGWLRERQAPDGSWSDRWHASPYYATMSCALALHCFGGAESRPAVWRAVRWALSTQRPDGSWGLWHGTAEETAYAMHLMLLTEGPEPTGPPSPGERVPRRATRRTAAARGYAYLLGANRLRARDTVSARDTGTSPDMPNVRDRPGRTDLPADPPMWHDKDLYLPVAIVRAAVLAALHLAQRDGAVAAEQDAVPQNASPHQP
ncbi:hypothetical protein Sme01_02120 [Sphaerisporangium melleum]|uniref:Squalene cyclase C-terminal domain-containing protein n=1 Tax=Sphaerisporangium melleum TaxID=321316 RepID=A0A917R4J8_9ACTN|nr:prenyltransferase/squalene oxidase repeat-containing protein [Sphaerisporangium melleum]GGK88864.1 hypothetical protein GCM10007964_34450 [Sphaerisporangium melleum]GII67736.1 hypothetical protein Sme01_02120 [Sphaerisporangium melleum]